MKLSRIGVFVGLFLIMTAGVGFAQSGDDKVVPSGSGEAVGESVGETVQDPAPPIPRTMVDKATIIIDGNALAKGEIAIVVETSAGKSHEARIGVVAKMKDKEIAQLLGRDLQFAMSQYLDFKVSGNKIKIDRVKKDKTTVFTVRVVYWSVFDVGFIVER